MKRHLTNEPLYGIAVYNPGILSKQELIRLFVARRALLQQIIDDLHREKPNGIPQHRLLVGSRGMGKTTLLRRISYAVEDDDGLRKEWLPLTFPEEQYNIARLSDLWLNCLDAVSDALERQGKHEEAETLDAIIDALPGGNEEERARTALNVLLDQAQKTGQRLLLLIDNIDLIFDRLAKEHWTIREMLSKEGAPLLIGATARPLEPTYEYQGAFYDFFKISNLNKLQLAEMHEVLRTLATETNAPQVSRLLDQDPARIRVLYDLTGGNPRTSVLLFSVLAQGIDGDVRSDLERLLDQCTPLYKARFEELSNQAQQVVDSLALHWDPAPASALAERARLDVNIVSSHLNRLSEQGIVEKVRLYPKKKTGFQIAERFFNIWYLMRASRRMRRKLIWLSRFLKSFYSQEDLHNLARRFFTKETELDETGLLKHAEYGFALAEALDDRGWRRALEHSASRITLDIHDRFRELLSDSAIDLDEVDQQTLTMKQIREKILGANVDWGNVDKEEFCDLLCGSPGLKSATKTKTAESLKDLPHDKLILVCKKLMESKEVILRLLNDDITIVNLLYKAIGMGLMESGSDTAGAESAQHVLDAPFLITVAHYLKHVNDQGEETLRQFKEHLIVTGCKYHWAWKLLGNTETKLTHYNEAESAYRRATELSPETAENWFRMGTLLGAHLHRNDEALDALNKSLQLDSNKSSAWCNYGNVLCNLERIEEGKDAYRKSIDIDPQNWRAWFSLGNILAHKSDYEGAEEAMRKALAIRPDDIDVIKRLTMILFHSDRISEIEKLVKRAIKIAPKDSALWNYLGIAQSYPDFSNNNAEKSFRKAIELDPENSSVWNNLANLFNKTSRFAESEQAYRHATQLDPTNLSFQLRLANLLIINKKWNEAELLVIQALQSAHDINENLLQAILNIFESAVANGYVNEAITLLAKCELDDSWRPLVEALKAVHTGTKDYFFNVSPEVRSAAEAIYDLLTGAEENRQAE